MGETRDTIKESLDKIIVDADVAGDRELKKKCEMALRRLDYPTIAEGCNYLDSKSEDVRLLCRLMFMNMLLG